MSIVKVSNLSSGYGKKQILEDISFELDAGTICGIIGVNGSGKSTLIKAMCNLLPHKGDCLIEDKSTSSMSNKELARTISMVPQKSGIAIDMSVLDVVLMGFNPYLGLLERPTSDMISKVTETLQSFGLSSVVSDNYQHLSEGQKQLCIIARSMVTDNKLIIMDEPESALDYTVRYQMMSILKKSIKETQKCLLASLHDINLALNYCDKLLLIKDKHIVDTIDKATDSLDVIESKLQKIYGSVCLHKITNKDKSEQLIMVRNSED